MNLEKVYIFRMTHIANIPHILKYGVTHKDSVNRNRNYVSIGDSTLISRRENYTLPNGKKLGDYIPFYFGKRTPMLYVIQNGFNGVQAVPAQEIVYCVTSVQKVIESKSKFVYTDGHATDRFTEFYSLSEVGKIQSQIDFNAIKARFWKEEADLDLKRRKEAEFLILDDLPPNMILGFVVYNKSSKFKLQEMGVEDELVHIDSNYYFSI